MKRVLLIVALVALMAGPAFALISGSAHDFRSQTWVTGNQICQPCHAPHGNQNAAGELLWNHDPTTASYTMYSNSSLALDGTVDAQPAGTSKVCLSCHDGTVALDSFGGATGTTFITGTFYLDTNLSNDHPISVTYPTSANAAAQEMVDPTALPAAVVLYNNKVECASCHDVHNTITGTTKLTVINNAASALCLACHVK